MSVTIPPLQAASLAQVVYQLQDSFFNRATIDRFKNSWDLSHPEAKVDGKSGTLWVIKKQTGFGIVAEGRGDQFGGDLLILLRGTDNTFDWATDATAGISWTEASDKVHTGFYKCFLSMKTELEQKLSRYKGKIRTVHCVGHSLGGALASLCANWLQTSNLLGQSKVQLYTFGSPRVGTEGFAKKLTHQLDLGTDIYRVFHKTDVVPMVPIWPFFHVPLKNHSYCLNSPGSLPSGEFHKMKNYVLSLSKSKDWGTLVDLEPPVSESAIEKWLASDGVYALTINSLNMINSALVYVIKKVLYGAGVLVQNSVGLGITLLDQLAMALAKGYNLAKDTSIWVLRLMKRIMVALGMKIKKDLEVTAQLIKFLLTALLEKVHRMVKTAVDFVFSE
ncbi:lipase family protein [Simiduia aestuariiviva]|uniref:Fungal lipase-type domain-containing protein n=1 Tax=Simiduia aestuariiviva TaxID=1510459 RepID=A0A839ULQ6_9GAMM|nr:lipase family protein [Simiduia aestuariiviva]MBB3167500.1 hypothetical protein [Simiduia aestuariiviva]